MLKEGGLFEDVWWFKHLPLLYLSLVSVEVSGDEGKYLKGRIGQLKDNIGEDIIITNGNDAL